MSNISIIGTGNMARTIGALAVAGGNTVEVMGRDQSKAADLAKALGGDATTGEWGAVPAGDIVIVAVLYDSVVPVVAEYGDALAGKAIVDISNPFNAAADGLAISEDKAFNTIFRHVLEKGRPDVFVAGDNAQAKATVEALVESLGLRPLYVGGLKMAHWLEGAGGKEQPYPPQMKRYLDPVLLWTVAATATSRVRLNASTLSTFYYEPPHLARMLTTLDVLSDGRLDVGVGLGWMKDEHDIARSADWRRRGRMLDDLLAFLHEWWTTTPVSWDSEFFSLPPVHAGLRPVQAGRPSGSAVPARPRCWQVEQNDSRSAMTRSMGRLTGKQGCCAGSSGACESRLGGQSDATDQRITDAPGIQAPSRSNAKGLIGRRTRVNITAGSSARAVLGTARADT